MWHAPGQRWRALSEAQRREYYGDLKLPSSGPATPARLHSQAPTSCLYPAPTPTAAPVLVPVHLSPTQLIHPSHPTPNPNPPASRGSANVAAVAVPVMRPAGFAWAAALAGRWAGHSKGTEQPSDRTPSSSSSRYSEHSFSSSEDALPAPGSTATSVLTSVPPPSAVPPAATAAAPPAAPPAVSLAAPPVAPPAVSLAVPSVAPPAAPPPLPAELAHMFDEPIHGLVGAPATPRAPSTAPNFSSSRWLDQQKLAEVLEEQLTGSDAIEVYSKTVRG